MFYFGRRYVQDLIRDSETADEVWALLRSAPPHPPGRAPPSCGWRRVRLVHGVSD